MLLAGLALAGILLLPTQGGKETARSAQPVGLASELAGSPGSGITVEYQPPRSSGTSADSSAPAGPSATGAGPVVLEPQTALPASSGDAAPTQFDTIALDIARPNSPFAGQPSEGATTNLPETPEIKIDLAAVQPALSALAQFAAQAQANATATATALQSQASPTQPGQDGGGAAPQSP